MKVVIRGARLAFSDALFEAKTVNGEGKPAFSSTFIMPPDHGSLGDINAAIEAVAKEKWGAKASAVLKELRAKDKVCLHDGDTKAQYDGFEGNMFVATRSGTRPLVLDRDKSPLTESDGKPYSGCYVNATIEVWPQDNAYGKRINAEIKGVQFVRDGDAFGGGGAPADPDDFEDLGEGVDEEALA